jgi:2-methylisocitrate lyase-like PEP mutase family enzyme
MIDTDDKARAFRTLHVPGRPLVLFNVWDAGSARIVSESGARAIATGSWSIAASHGLTDGENLPFDDAIGNLRRIVRTTDLPVTIDIESGYGDSASELGRNVARTIEAGAVGCNLEDSIPGNGKLRGTEAQAERIGWVRKAAETAGRDYFINARTDVFFQGPPETHDGAMVDEALKRARAYADAGADGIFVPGLVDLALIGRMSAASPLPVNVMVGEGSPAHDALADAGVARISHGPGPYLQAMAALAAGARAAVA